MDEEVTNDLRALANLELPKDDGGKSSHLVKVTVLLFVIFILGAFLVVTLAWRASMKSEDAAEVELACVRASTVLFDKRLSEGLGLLIDTNNLLLGGLYAYLNNVTDPVDEALASLPARVREGELVKQNLEQAIKARETALREC